MRNNFATTKQGYRFAVFTPWGKMPSVTKAGIVICSIACFVSIFASIFGGIVWAVAINQLLAR